MKAWKRLVSGLLGLMLLASLTGSALAAEPTVKGEAKETAKSAAVEPAGQFSRWFPRIGLDPDAPKASEAVLGRMGTAIQQSKTAGGVTVTLNGAIWDGDTVRLSLTLKSSNIPKEVAEGTNLYTEECSLTLPEEQWKEYVRKDEERHGGSLSKDLLEKCIQVRLDEGQTSYWRFHGVLDFVLLSREKDTLTFEVPMSFADYLEQPELTLHLENIATYEDGKGDGVTWQGDKRTGPGPDTTILKGPIDFTFQLKNVVPAATYTEDIPVTVGEIPLRLTGFEISAFALEAEFDILGLVDNRRPDEDPDPARLDNVDVTNALSTALQGVWTADGGYVDFEGGPVGMAITSGPEGEDAKGSVNRSYPYVVDPAAVTAVNLGGTRMELSGRKLPTE